MSLSSTQYEAADIIRALSIRKEDAINLESAKISLSYGQTDPEILREITNKYKAVTRLIRWLESKL